MEGIADEISWAFQQLKVVTGRWGQQLSDIVKMLQTITLAGIACIIMREVYATIGESIYWNLSSRSRDFPEVFGTLLTNLT